MTPTEIREAIEGFKYMTSNEAKVLLSCATAVLRVLEMEKKPLISTTIGYLPDTIEDLGYNQALEEIKEVFLK